MRFIRPASYISIRAGLSGAAVLIMIAASSAMARAQADSGDSSADSPQQSPPSSAPLSDVALQAEVDRSLSDASATANQALSDMAASEGSGLSQSLRPVNISSLPPELQRPVTVSWTGPADALVQRVAQGIGYTYTETGTPPVVPDMVVVRYNNEPAAIVLQDLGLRINKVGQISIDTTARAITYVNNAPQIAPLPAPAAPPPSPASDPMVHHHSGRPPSTIDGYPKSLFIGGQ